MFASLISLPPAGAAEPYAILLWCDPADWQSGAVSPFEWIVRGVCLVAVRVVCSRPGP